MNPSQDGQLKYDCLWPHESKRGRLADSDLDENNCNESGGELILVIFTLLRMF
jgi:hypothetical protein